MLLWGASSITLVPQSCSSTGILPVGIARSGGISSLEKHRLEDFLSVFNGKNSGYKALS
jgi:hypothetical protein